MTETAPPSAPDLVARLREGKLTDGQRTIELLREAADQLEAYCTAYGLINQRLLDMTRERDEVEMVLAKLQDKWDARPLSDPDLIAENERLRAALRGFADLRTIAEVADPEKFVKVFMHYADKAHEALRGAGG